MEKTKSLREEAIDIIKGGGSVLLRANGERRLYSQDNLHELPSEADLAIGDSKAEQLALDGIEAEISRLEAAKKKLADAKRAEKPVAAPKTEATAAPAKKETEEDKK